MHFTLFCHFTIQLHPVVSVFLVCNLDSVNDHVPFYCIKVICIQYPSNALHKLNVCDSIQYHWKQCNFHLFIYNFLTMTISDIVAILFVCWGIVRIDFAHCIRVRRETSDIYGKNHVSPITTTNFHSKSVIIMPCYYIWFITRLFTLFESFGSSECSEWAVRT